MKKALKIMKMKKCTAVSPWRNSLSKCVKGHLKKLFYFQVLAMKGQNDGMVNCTIRKQDSLYSGKVV